MTATKLSDEYKWNPTSGQVQSLVFLVRWADHRSRPLPTRTQIVTALNGPVATRQSVWEYFRVQSQGRLDLRFTVADWLEMPWTEYDARSKLDLVIQFINTKYPLRPSEPLILLHSGYDAVYRRLASDGVPPERRFWSNIAFQPLVPGQYEPLQRYVITSALNGTAGNLPLNPAIICHEIGHTFGLPHHLLDPDTHYCLMVNHWNYDASGLRPAPLCKGCLEALGWLAPAVAPPVTDKIAAFNLMPNPMIPDNVLLANEVTISNLRKAVNS